MILKGSPPTGKQLSQIYLDPMRQYYGHDKGVVRVDEVQAAQWMNTPVSFDSFDGLNFPLSNSAGSMLVEKLRAGDAKVKKGFEARFSNDSDDITSYDLLKQLDIDLTSQDPYQAYFRRLNFLITELEQTLADKR